MGPWIASVLAVAGPGPWGPGFWRRRPRPPYSQRVPAMAREKLGVRDRGRTAETRPSSSPPRRRGPPQLHGSLRCKAMGAFAQGTGRNCSPKQKKRSPAGTRRRPASRPKQQPRSARASHSPTRRCRASTAGEGTTTAASSGLRPGPAPTTPPGPPRAAPPPASRGPRFRRRLSAGLRDLVPSVVFGHPSGASTELRQPTRTSLVCLGTTPTEKERAIGRDDTTNAIFHVGGTSVCLTRLRFLVGHHHTC
ncbi:synapsin-1-like [Mesocricetus auratus]|uniref:Synapsin-1-like n=1 Tax=Mesocricetus auratus TaxID=10036 RepID=A0ABM2X5Y2_MESAU|nr:synapsin-1-like [Mesocricetus auratus]